jgi:hypothetical protein
MPNEQVLPDGELQDGFAAEVFFSEDETLVLKLTTLQPPVMDGDGGLDQTTMKNETVRTQLPGGLAVVGEMTMEAACLTSDFSKIAAMHRINQQIVWKWPNGKFGMVWGWIETYGANGLEINGKPLSNFKILVSNVNASGAETLPEYELDANPIE